MVYNAEYAAKYARTIETPYTQYKLDLVQENLAHPDGMQQDILDVGCNINPYHPLGLRSRLKESARYTGIDVSPAYFDNGETEVPRVVVGSAEHMPFADGSFDAVVAADVLEHIPALSATAAQIARVLRRRGEAHVIIPQLYKLDALPMSEVRANRPTSHVHFMTAPAWAQAVGGDSLRLNPEKSRAIGRLSGLLYTTWLNPTFISHEGHRTPDSKVFTAAKKEASSVDASIDALPAADVRDLVAQPLLRGDVAVVLRNMTEVAEARTGQELPAVRELVDRFRASESDPRVQAAVARTVGSSAMGLLTQTVHGLANSAYLVLEKK